MTRFLKALDDAPVAPLVEKANEQHYEVPAAFFAEVLGPHLKYSSAFWQDVDNLGEAEAQGLRLSCEHAALEDGQDILELGCGWGSLTLWIARSTTRTPVSPRYQIPHPRELHRSAGS